MKEKLSLYIILTLLFSFSATNAQEEKQNVELPEFVITGVERISVQAAAKPKAEPMTMLSGEFFKPIYSTEDLSIAELSNPMKKDIAITLPDSLLEGSLLLGGGRYRLPVGRFSYSKNLDNVIFLGEIWGVKDLEYVDNSGYDASGLKLSTMFFTGADSGFFHGMQLGLNARYDRDAYRFFASMTPKEQRERHKGNFSFNIKNLVNRKFAYGVSLKDDIFYLKDIDLNENVVSLNAFSNTAFDKFKLDTKIDFSSQNINRVVMNGRKNSSYFSARGMLSFFPGENLSLGGGLVYSGTDSLSFFAPSAQLGLKLTDKISLSGRYSPNAEYLTLNDLTSLNRYYIPSYGHVFYKNKNLIELSAKYEYETYFEVNAGISFVNIEDYFYFTDDRASGLFSLKRTDADRYQASINALFHNTLAGRFYGSLVLDEAKNPDGLKVPYHPYINLDVEYNYSFLFGLDIGASVSLKSKSFADSLNTKSVPAYFNAGVSLSYEVVKNFNIFTQLSNLFDNKNYTWYNYREKPFDLVAGFEYRW